MNKKLKKQIKAYAGFAGVLLATEQANSQIVYVDVTPDDTLIYSPIKYDMDQDGQNDFQFYFQPIWHNIGSSSSHLDAVFWVIGYNNNQVLKGNYSGCGYFSYAPNAFLLNQADSIPFASQLNNFVHYVKLEDWETGFYQSSTNQLCFFAMTPLNQDNCIGIKFVFNGQIHYGWFKVRLLDKKVIIKEYAYQLQPNVPMLACDTTNLATGISEYNHQQFYFSQQNNSIHISSFQKLINANISVYDLLGKEILRQPFEGKETTITIDKKGIYFVEVKPIPNSSGSEKGIFRKKIFIY